MMMAGLSGVFWAIRDGCISRVRLRVAISVLYGGFGPRVKQTRPVDSCKDAGQMRS
jgi:hypothetical protein